MCLYKSIINKRMNSNFMKQLIPWYLRIVIKVLLARLPIAYGVWSRLGLFRHGSMDSYDYAWNIIKLHTTELVDRPSWRGLELGPGDAMTSAFLAIAAGAESVTLVDSGNFAHRDVELYRRQIEHFSATNPEADLIKFDFSSIDSLLESAGAKYLSTGLVSMKSIPSSSVDLVYSQAVLEHIRVSEFEDTMRECYRIMDTGGLMSHVVDFKDHLGGGLNNLRFPTSLWERDWFALNSGFYTNRIRFSQMLKIGEKVGFTVSTKSVTRWESKVIADRHVAEEFSDLTLDDLLVSGAHIMFTK